MMVTWDSRLTLEGQMLCVKGLSTIGVTAVLRGIDFVLQSVR